MLKLLAAVTALAVAGCGPSTSASLLHDASGADATAAVGAVGSWTVFEQDYKFPAAVDPNILADRSTEIWALLYLPKEDGAFAAGPVPVLVFLHGNHGTCGKGENPRVDDREDYTMLGTCPDGYVVTPNHRGYDYLARNMASQGYAVISINANRGITAGDGVFGDSGLNLARGALVLSHLALLAKWTNEGGSLADAGVDLKGKLDLSQVGLMGHSRGGEGVRAAYNLYNDAGSPWPARVGPMTVRGIFEIAPVDGQTSRTLDALGTSWNVMIGLCDGDVSNFQGVRPFDRMLKQLHEPALLPKSTLLVWGANHDFFNTEWQTSDADGCDDHTPIFDPSATGSDKQRTISLAALSSFFRAHVGKVQEPLSRVFDPAFDLPASMTQITPLGRDFVLTPDLSKTVRLLDLDDSEANSVLSATKATTAIQALAMHDDRDGVAITWTEGGGDVALRLAPADLSHLATLDLSLQILASGHVTDFSIKLITGAGAESAAVALSQARLIEGSTGRLLLQTVRFPLTAFTGIDLTQVTGLRVVLDKTATGKIIIGSVRASAPGEALGAAAGAAPVAPLSGGGSGQAPAGVHGTGQVTDAQLQQGTGAHGPDGSVEPAMVAVSVQSGIGFPVRSALPVLYVGNKTYDLSGYGGDKSTLVFRVPALEFKGFQAGDQVTVAYGELTTSTYVIDAGTMSADILSGAQ